MTLRDLAHEWKAEAERLRSRYGLEEMARLCEAHLAELLETVTESEDQALTLDDAARESGYSKRRLRELVSAGEVPNAGEKGRPRIRRADLPRRVSRTDRFDAAAHAAEVIG